MLKKFTRKPDNILDSVVDPRFPTQGSSIPNGVPQSIILAIFSVKLHTILKTLEGGGGRGGE